MTKSGLQFFTKKNNFLDTKDIISIEIIKSDLNFTPKISIAIPTFRRSDLLRETIQSVFDQQGFNEYDIIVVDNDPERDCSTEKLMHNIIDKRVSYYKNKANIGMAGNWNRLFELAKGEYVVILHDDDLLYPNYLYIIHQILSKSDNFLDAIYPQYKYLDNNVASVWPPQKMSRSKKYIELTYKDFALSNIIGAPVGIVFRKSKVLEIGGFDRDFYPSLDYAFYVKFSYYFKSIKLINNEITLYRIHKNESQKLSTLLSFIEKDMEIKKHIVENSSLKFLKKLFTLYHGVANEIYLVKMARLFLIQELQDTRKISETPSKFSFFKAINYKILNKFWGLRFYLSQKSFEI